MPALEPSPGQDEVIPTQDTPETNPQYLFTQESFVHRARLMVSDYGVHAINQVWDSELSYAAKRAFIDKLTMAFDKNVVLAKTEDLFRRHTLLEIGFNVMLASFSKHDKSWPGLQSLIDSSLQAFTDYSSRSQGGWERIQQGRMETRNEQVSTVNQNIRQSSPERRGLIGGLLGGGR